MSNSAKFGTAIELPGNPSSTLRAVTKGYCDTRVIARVRRTTATTGTTATTPAGAQKIAELDAALTAGRLYRIAALDVPVGSNAPGNAFLMLTYTTDGSTPTTTSSVLTYGGGATISSYLGLHVSVLYAPTADLTLKVLLSAGGNVAGTYYIGAASTWPLDLTCEDLGVDPGSTGVSL